MITRLDPLSLCINTSPKRGARQSSPSPYTRSLHYLEYRDGSRLGQGKAADRRVQFSTVQPFVTRSLVGGQKIHFRCSVGSRECVLHGSSGGSWQFFAYMYRWVTRSPRKALWSELPETTGRRRWRGDPQCISTYCQRNRVDWLASRVQVSPQSAGWLWSRWPGEHRCPTAAAAERRRPPRIIVLVCAAH